MDIDNLIERLMSLTYRDKGDKYDFNVISFNHRNKVFDEIKSWSKAQDITQEIITKEYEIIEVKKKIAELEAKVYTYEKIIANSNFAPILPKWVDYPITCNEKGEL